MQLDRSLKNFYRAYWNWLEDGAPEKNDNPHNFSRGFGLCSNLTSYFLTGDYGEVDQAYRPAKNEMRGQFLLAGLSEDTPFNPGDYFMESFDCVCHLNVRRIEWVKSHAEAE